MIQKTPAKDSESLKLSNKSNTQQYLSKSQSWLSGKGGLLVGIVLGIGLTFIYTNVFSAKSEKQSVATTEVTNNTKPAQTVTIAQVTSSQVNRTLEATGTVAAKELISVISQESGLKVVEIIADEGDFVNSGQVLAKVDNGLLQAQLNAAQASLAQAQARLAELEAGTRIEEINQAKARLDQSKASLRQAEASIPRKIQQAVLQVESAQAQFNLAESRYRSYQNLIASGAITRDQFNQIKSQYDSAKANLFEVKDRLEQAKNTNNPELDQLRATVRENEQRLNQLQSGVRPEIIAQAEAQVAQEKAQVNLIEKQIQDTLIVAPRSGKIVERSVNVGDLTSNSEELFQIIENGNLELLLKLPETDVTQIKIGQEVAIKSDIDKSLILSGQVIEIVPQVTEQSRQIIVKVSLPQVDSIKPGMFLKGEIITESNQGLTVPIKAVLPQSDGSAIAYKLGDNNIVNAVKIEMGEILPYEKIEIKSGLNINDKVVVKGAAYLKDGNKVNISK